MTHAARDTAPVTGGGGSPEGAGPRGGCMSAVTFAAVLLVCIALLFVPPLPENPGVTGHWVPCRPPLMTAFGARLQADHYDEALSDAEFSDGFISARTSPSWFTEGPESAPAVGIHVANATCNRATAVRLAWAIPLMIALFVARSLLKSRTTARRERRT